MLTRLGETQVDVNGVEIRLTHIIRPHVVKPTAPPPSHALLTPETSDLSGPSDSESPLSADSATDTDVGVDTEMETETETETDIGTEDGHDDNGYHIADGTAISRLSLHDHSFSQTQAQPLGEGAPGLHRVHSNASYTSSAYASSEGGSEMYDSMGESMTLPPLRAVDSLDSAASMGSVGWVEVRDDGMSDDERGALNARAFAGMLGDGAAMGSGGTGPARMARLNAGREWEDKPSFFEYLYGA
jgi:hypothetical protein